MLAYFMVSLHFGCDSAEYELRLWCLSCVAMFFRVFTDFGR